jgi:hypothetical protein
LRKIDFPSVKNYQLFLFSFLKSNRNQNLKDGTHVEKKCKRVINSPC